MLRSLGAMRDVVEPQGSDELLGDGQRVAQSLNLTVADPMADRWLQNTYYHIPSGDRSAANGHLCGGPRHRYMTERISIEEGPP